MWFRCEMFDHYFIINLLLSLFWNSFWNRSIFGKFMGKKFIASCALYAGALSCWKVKKSLEIWHMVGSNGCHSIMLRLILLSSFDSVIGKHQVCVMSTTCDSPTDVGSDWMLNAYTGILSRCLSSWLMTDVHTVSHSVCFLV